MNRQESKNLVFNTFEKSFDESQFILFIRNLLNNIDNSKAGEWLQGQYIYQDYRDSVKRYRRVGQYKDAKNNVLDVLIVNLYKETTLERARTKQRNFLAKYLKNKNREAALIAYYVDEYEDWRFSLVKLDFSLNKTKIEIELSPAKRYSFLVGANERSHTAQSQFQKILTEIPNPSLDELEQAFNIETVTKEFFLEYRDLFIRTKESLDKVIKNDSKIKNEFESKGVSSVDFSKKLLGQIIFLYFLQKKGWFGVERDSDWGTGSKKFLRELLDKKHGDYKNFFNDILEPLFYEALRYDRQDYYYSRFNCKIPFLNGGLFDPINNYDWVHTDIILPNELFSNKNKTSQGDTGDGIFDIFDRYNFTVIEDEPLEKEVAIDPELLGKAYEKFNAIRPDNFDEYRKALKNGKKGDENKFNKQYGVYYTPREIVHYMCRESLINYVASEFSDKTDAYQKVSTEQLDAFGNTARKGQLSLEAEYKPNPHIPKEDIETLINYGELLGENEAVVVSKGKETETYSHKLPESIRKNAELIDEKLSDILVCDPAVGSGAFPVGMMHEIVSTRNLLSIYINDKSRTIYKFKRDCIEKSLYGVDIDSGAVEIAKLRLWLSLVVDEDDINNIKPLPNLDYKIVRGNSLLGFPENWKSSIALKIEALKKEFLKETNPTHKNKLKNEIDVQINKRMENSETNFGYKIDFDFKTFFSEVFHLKGGFDIIIANPPYITIALGKKQKIFTEKEVANYKKLYKDVFEYKGNTFSLFIYKGIHLIKQSSILTFIIPNTLLLNSTFQKTRRYLISSGQLKLLLNITDKVFDSAEIGGNLVLLFQNSQSSDYFVNVASIENLSMLNHIDTSQIPINLYNSHPTNNFTIDINTLYLENKIKNGTELLGEVANFYNGIKSGDNKRFLSEKKNNSKYRPVIRGKDITKYRIHFGGIYILFDKKLLWSNTNESYLLKTPKIIIRQTGDSLCATYDRTGFMSMDTTHLIFDSKIKLKVVLALLNSSLVNWYYQKMVSEVDRAFAEVKIINLKKLPIKSALSPSQEKLLIKLVDEILESKENDFKVDTKHIEDKIDIMVYKLYDLTYEEVKIIDPAFALTEKEYEEFKIE